MIDIHNHIIFGVDDGAKNIEESLDIIEELVASGVNKIICTPHRRKNMFETENTEIIAKYEKLKKEVEELYEGEVEIYLGSEVYYTEEMLKEIEEKKILTLLGSKYILVEFNYNYSYKDIEEAVINIKSLGYIPIIAHIERYNDLEKDIKRVEKLKRFGAIIQVNAKSVLKIKLFGDSHKTYKKRAKILLENDLVDIIATDAHNLDTRRPHLKEAAEIIEKKYGRDRRDRLFLENRRNDNKRSKRWKIMKS